MSYKITFSARFKSSFKKLTTDKKEEALTIIERLANNETLEQKYNDHALKGEYLGFRECHLKPDLLLIYQKRNDILTLYCFNIGSHSNLFKK